MFLDDRPEEELLEESFEKVLQHPAFSRYTREQLQSCATFCEMLRQAQHADVVDLRDELEEIGFNTDDHNEACGFLNVFAALGGGFEANAVVDEGIDQFGDGLFPDLAKARECFPDVPVQDATRFADWVIDIDSEQRSLACQAASDALLKQVVRIADQDREARLTHHQVNMLLYYALTDLNEHLEFANYARENLDDDFPVRQQIPGRLWEAFNARPGLQAEQLIEKWWGPGADIPNDFFIALEWQREGHIEIHRGKQYHETVAEFLLDSCDVADSADHGGPGHGIEAIRLDPFLAQDLYDALRLKQPYRWLISDDMASRARYLDELFGANALQRRQILCILENGIAKRWDSDNLSRYEELRDYLSA